MSSRSWLPPALRLGPRPLCVRPARGRLPDGSGRPRVRSWRLGDRDDSEGVDDERGEVARVGDLHTENRRLDDLQLADAGFVHLSRGRGQHEDLVVGEPGGDVDRDTGDGAGCALPVVDGLEAGRLGVLRVDRCEQRADQAEHLRRTGSDDTALAFGAGVDLADGTPERGRDLSFGVDAGSEVRRRGGGGGEERVGSVVLGLQARTGRRGRR